jgi:phosphoribosylformylglycinamidine synthase
MIMPTYNVHVIIENKSGISDPEGDTILNDLVLKGKNSSVKKIRSGKILKFTMIAKNKKSAENTVGNICQELRIYNPLVSKVLIESKPI